MVHIVHFNLSSGPKAQPVSGSPTLTGHVGHVSESSVGINGTLNKNVSDPIVQSVYQKAYSAGIRWIRISCNWHDFEPHENQFSFTVCDRMVDGAYRAGLRVELEFSTTSTYWCTTSPALVTYSAKKGNAIPLCTDRQFQFYVFNLVSRYGANAHGLGAGYGKNEVGYFEVDNESDLNPEYSSDPASYAKVLYLAHQTIKQTDPDAQVLLGGLALGGQSDNHNFGISLLNDPHYPALNNFDIFNYHTYAKVSDMANTLADIRALIPNKPIWVTEVGYPSLNDYQTKYRHSYPYAPGEKGQSEYLEDAIPFLLSHGVAKVFWYNLLDLPSDTTPFCSYGIFYIPQTQCQTASSSNPQILKTKSAYQTLKSLLSPPGK